MTQFGQRYWQKPAFPPIETQEIWNRIYQRRGGTMATNAEIHEVWVGFRFQCHDCHAVLEPGDKFARMDDDSSTVLCIDCLVRRQQWAQHHSDPIGPTEFKEPDRHGTRWHRREADWMEFD